MARPTVGAIVIGRNEGPRLKRCLSALSRQVARTVYVDSGSSDGSIDVAQSFGCDIVELDPSIPFTAARARNAGVERIGWQYAPNFLQFVDGDCELDPGWLDAALSAMKTDNTIAVVCGRRRERHPEATIYNRLIDREWDTPIGGANACGGDAMVRTAALISVDGFNPSLIAGEEPELCFRLRRAGWNIRRVDADMTLHDADLTRFAQWWRRSRRAGHAFAEGAAMHGTGPEHYNVREVRRALVWGAGLPLVVVSLAVIISPLALLALAAYPMQVLRLSRREGWVIATFLTLGKFPEAQGIVGYRCLRIVGRKQALIEYKTL